jgi:hypothetical protein
LVKKYRAEKNKYENKLNESPLLGDLYPHSVMAIESVQDLKRMQGPVVNGQNLAQNYLD